MRNPHAGRRPARECFRHVWVHLTLELAARIAVLPDASLKRLERAGFAIAIHQAVDVADDVASVAARRLVAAVGQLAPAARCSARRSSTICANFRSIAVRLEEESDARARVRKEHVVHEGDRRGRAFDVEQDDGDARRPERTSAPLLRSAAGPSAPTYAGPKQSGWNPRSTPLSV